VLVPASNGTINRELSALSRAYTLDAKHQHLTYRPYIEELDEHEGVRSGFFEDHQFLAVRSALPEHLRPVSTLALLRAGECPKS